MCVFSLPKYFRVSSKTFLPVIYSYIIFKKIILYNNRACICESNFVYAEHVSVPIYLFKDTEFQVKSTY